MWKILDTGTRRAKENMEIDADLLAGIREGSEPILHLYDWEKPSATYGYFIKPGKFFDLETADSSGFDLARRPTGGGIVFHTTDLAFSAIVPSGHDGYHADTLDNYAFINRFVQKAVEKLLAEQSILLPQDPVPLDKATANFCFAKPTIYDVMLHGRKIAGAAQRKKANGFLHQGSISIAPPAPKYLLEQTKVVAAMQQNTYPILTKSWTNEQLQMMRKRLRELLVEQVGG